MNLPKSELFSRGETIDGRYRVDDTKRGNMGVVYLCTDVKKNDPIAIKTFDSRFLHTEAGLRNFLNEASTWIQLERHPNIVEARSLKMIDGHPYLFLERVIADNPRGATLKDLFFTQTLDDRRMIQIAIHICDGMIHALNVFPNLVHRDLKSENILIGREGLPKVSDFGMTMRPEIEDAAPLEYQYDLDLPFHPRELARRMEGTPAYASPEQCQGQPLDTRSDIYSFGCILYHMATKHLPFHRATVEETILAHIRETPQTPCDRNDMIPADFSRIVMRCLEKEARKRYVSFYDLRMELIDLYEFHFYECPNTFQTGIPLTVEDYVERAKSFALLSQFNHARSELMKALRRDPTRPQLYYYLGRFSYMEGQYKRALLELKEALRGIPHSADLHEILGKTYQALDYSDEAELHFREALSMNPESDSTYHSLAVLLLNRGDMKNAESILIRAVSVCSNKVPFYLRLAQLHEKVGNPEKQYDYLEKAIQFEPKQSECLLRLAELSLNAKKNHQAIEWTERAAKCQLTAYSDLYRLGRLYMELKNPRRAAEIWKNAAATGEGGGQFYYQFASLCHSLRNYEDAWRYIQRAEEKGEDVGALKFDIQARRLKGR